MSDSNGSLEAYAFFVTLGLILLLVFNYRALTFDGKIISGDKILINNAVYRCEKLQELDLK